jgi:hypothetical protein
MKRPLMGDALRSGDDARAGMARAVAALVARLRNFRRVQGGWVTLDSDYIRLGRPGYAQSCTAIGWLAVSIPAPAEPGRGRPFRRHFSRWIKTGRAR